MSVMDRDTAEHFYAWLERHIAECEQHEVEQNIHGLLRNYPELLTTHSWSEIRRIAEGQHDARFDN